MALKQWETTRWIARVGTWIKAAVYFIAEVLESFLNVKEDDKLRVKGIKTVDFVIRRGIYFAADYWLAGLSLAIGVAMKALGFPLLEMFFALWVFDFAAAGLFVVVYEMTGKDLSLGEDFRRAVDTINKRSWLAGLVTTAWVIFLAIVWTGPEKVITFFRKEIGTIRRVIAVLVVLTAIQAFIWALLYSFAYDQIVKLL